MPSTYKIIYTGLPYSFQPLYSLKTYTPKDSNNTMVLIIYEEITKSYKFYILDENYNKISMLRVSTHQIKNFIENEILTSMIYNDIIENITSLHGNCEYAEDFPFLKHDFLKYHNGYYQGHHEIFEYCNNQNIYNYIKLKVDDESLLSEIKMNYGHQYENNLFFDSLNFLEKNISNFSYDRDVYNLSQNINLEFEYENYEVNGRNYFSMFKKEGPYLYISFFYCILYNNVKVKYVDDFLFRINFPFTIQINLIHDSSLRENIYVQYNIVPFFSGFFSIKYQLLGLKTFSTSIKKNFEGIYLKKNNQEKGYVLSSLEIFNPYIERYNNNIYNEDIKKYLLELDDLDENDIKFPMFIIKSRTVSPLPIDKKIKLDFSLPLIMVFD